MTHPRTVLVLSFRSWFNNKFLKKAQGYLREDNFKNLYKVRTNADNVAAKTFAPLFSQNTMIINFTLFWLPDSSEVQQYKTYQRLVYT